MEHARRHRIVARVRRIVPAADRDAVDEGLVHVVDHAQRQRRRLGRLGGGQVTRSRIQTDAVELATRRPIVPVGHAPGPGSRQAGRSHARARRPGVSPVCDRHQAPHSSPKRRIGGGRIARDTGRQSPAVRVADRAHRGLVHPGADRGSAPACRRSRRSARSAGLRSSRTI